MVVDQRLEPWINQRLLSEWRRRSALVLSAQILVLPVC